MGVEVKEGRCVYCHTIVENVRAFNCICEECYEKKRKEGYLRRWGQHEHKND